MTFPMPRRSFTLGLLMLASAGMAGACQAAPAAAPVDTSMTQAPRKTNGSGIVLRYRIEGTPAVGQPVNVALEFAGARGAGAAPNASFSADDGLRIRAGGEPLALQPGVTRHVVQLVPQRDGLFYLNVFTVQDGASNATAIALQVGAGQQKAAPAELLKTTPSGEKIISLPVQ